MPNDLCILLSTCAHYTHVAQFTRAFLERNWNPLPPLFLCGIEAADALPLRDDPADWMAVLHTAAWDLLGKGYRWCYLILDDLPPVGACDPHHLNETLPGQAQELSATVISLLGWGQRRPLEGEDLGPGLAHLSRNRPDYKWKFSLHPGLWDLDRLAKILRARMETYPRGQRTPWNFERHADADDGPVPREVLASTFRIHGRTLSGWTLSDRFREGMLFGCDVYRFLLRMICGQQARERFDRDGLWLHHYYKGPYPLFWSGAMRQGKPGIEFGVFLRRLGQPDMREAWEKVNRLHG